MSVRSKSKRRLLILVAGVLALCMAAGGFYVYRKARIRHEFARLRADGLAAARAGDHARVVECLGQYLRRDPSDEAVLVEYAKSRLLVPAPRNQHKVQAIMVLRHLVRLHPERTDELRTLLSLYAESGYVTETAETAKLLAAKFPNDPQVLDLEAHALLRLRDYAAALAAAQKCLEVDPERAGVAVVAVDAMRQSGTPSEKIAETANSWKLWGRQDDGRAELVRGYVLLQTGDREQAVKTLRTAASRPWTDVENGKTLVGLLERLAATEKLPAAAAADAADPTLTDLSLSLLEQLSKAAPADRTVREALARRYWEVGRADDVARLLAPGGGGKAAAADDELANANTESLALRASALAQLKQSAEAAKIRDALAARADDAEAAAWVGVLRQGEAGAPDARRFAELCEAALDRNPDSAYLRYFLGSAYKQLGEDDRAQAAWTEAAQRSTTWAAPLVRLADSLLSSGRYGAAFGAARAAVSRARRDAAANAVFLRVAAECVSRGTFGSADEGATRAALLADLGRMQQQFPGEESTLLGQVSLLARSGKDDERRQAADLIAKAVESGTKLSEATLIRLAAVARAAKLGVDDKCYARAEKDYGPTPALAYAHACDRLAAGDAAGGLKLMNEAAARPEAKAKPAFELARLRYLDLAGDPGAKAGAAALGDARPQDLTVQQSLLQLNAVAADRDLMDRTIQRVRGLTGEQAVNWRVARARWYLRFSPGAAGLKEATGLLTEVVRRSPDSLEARVLLGRTLMRAGDLAGAADQFTAAGELDPASVPAALDLAEVLQARGDQTRAARQLDKVTGPLASAMTVEDRRRAAALLSQQGRIDQAVTLLEPTAAAGDRPSAFLLADLYRSGNRKDQLAASVEKLLQHPDSVTIAFVADLYGSQGRQADAQAVLARLDSLKLEPGEKQLILADFTARYGSPDEACNLYDAATKARPHDGRAWRSLISSRLALGQAKEALEANKEAARQNPTDGAFVAVQQNADLLSASVLDARLSPLAVVYARDPVSNAAVVDLLRVLADERKQAGGDEQPLNARLAQIAAGAPHLTLVQATVAERYLAAGRVEDAVGLAARAVQAAPNSADALRLQTTVLAAAGRWSEALQAAARWRERSGDAPLEADTVIADAYLATGQAAQAVKQLEPYAGLLPKAGQAPTEPLNALQQRLAPAYARALEAAGRTEDAARVMEPLFKSAPGWRQGWLMFAVRRLPEARAAAWIQRVADMTPGSDADQVAIAEMWTLLAERTQNPSYAGKAREILAGIAARPDAPSSALAALAIRNEQDGHLTEAEAMYRRALAMDAKADPRQSVAPTVRNNLAMLLARRSANAAELKEAARLAAEAVAAAPTAAPLHDTLAFVHAKAGNYSDAVRSEQEAVKYAQGDPNYHVSLARYLVHSGQADTAAQVLTRLEGRFASRSEQITPEVRGQIQEIRDLIAKSAPVGQNRASAQ